MKTINPFEDLDLSLKQLVTLTDFSEDSIKSVALDNNIKFIKSDIGDLFISVEEAVVITKILSKETFKNINSTFNLTIGTQKGGVGKTTISYQLGIYYAMLGYKILYVDMDAQSNLTSLFGDNAFEGESSLYDYFTEKNSLNDLILKVNDNISIIPSNAEVGDINAILEKSAMESKESESKIKRMINSDSNEFNTSLFTQFRNDLGRVSKGYDFVIFDTHPETNYLNRLALQCSQLCLVPMEPTNFSMKSLKKVVPEMRESLLMSDTDYRDENIRVLLNFTRPIKNQASKDKKIKEMSKGFGAVLLNNHIDFHYELTEATDLSFPIWAYPETTMEAISDFKMISLELLEFVNEEHFRSIEPKANVHIKRTLAWG
jgi:cellulose biosynthesis protein BcsQ